MDTEKGTESGKGKSTDLTADCRGQPAQNDQKLSLEAICVVSEMPDPGFFISVSALTVSKYDLESLSLIGFL